MNNWKSVDLLDSTKEVFQICEDKFGEDNWPIIVVEEYSDSPFYEDKSYIVDLDKWRQNLIIDYSFDYVEHIIKEALDGVSYMSTSRKYSFSDTYNNTSTNNEGWKIDSYDDSRKILKICVEIY